MKIGFCLPHETAAMGGATASGADVLRFARRAEAIGFDSVWLVDHFCYFAAAELEALGASAPPELAGRVFGAWECMVTAGALARETRRVEIGTLVVNTGYRNPALLARMADTIDELSEGRLILGLGAGDFESEHVAFGYPWERRVGRFEEALQIIRPLLRGEKVTFEGEFYTAQEAENIPKGSAAVGAADHDRRARARPPDEATGRAARGPVELLARIRRQPRAGIRRDPRRNARRLREARKGPPRRSS